MRKDFIKNLKETFERGFIESTFDVGGKKWCMRTLNGLESLWKDRYVDLSVSASFLTSNKIPTLAIAIKSIDDVPIVEIFYGDNNIPENDTVDSIMSAVNKRGDDFSRPEFTAAENFKKFIEESIPTDVIDELWGNYKELEGKSTEMLTGIIKDVSEEKKEIEEAV